MLAYTRPMVVTYAECSSSGILTFILAPPYAKPLFLGMITITKVGAKEAVVGDVKPGANQITGGYADLQANDKEYEYLRGFVPLAGKFTVELGYETKNSTVSEIICATKGA